MPLEKLYAICDNEDTPELKEKMEILEKRMNELLHSKDDLIDLELLLVDIIAAAEKSGIYKGIFRMLNYT